MTEPQDPPTSPPPPKSHAAEVEHFSFWYGPKQALFDINLPFVERKVTALIGPSGCGKSTLLRSINRMNDLIDNTHHEGHIRLLGEDVYHPATDVIEVRKKCGMVFQRSNPFPKTIFENVVFGLRIDGVRDKRVLQTACERSLRSAALWDEVKDRLHDSALNLSGGQQQRLCIARAVATNPTVLLMDEPCSALDPVATVRIEELIHELSSHFTVVIVTHNMQQAARVSDFTAFFHLGKLVEFGETRTIFTRPVQQQTEDYITGKFG